MHAGRCNMVILLVVALHIVSSSADSAQDFQYQDTEKWYDIPKEVFLGLLTNQSSKVERVKLLSGNCFQYDMKDNDRCKYYSDCCGMAPARPMEQLAPGTFSCHNGFYVVDKCPDVTLDLKLKRLCEQETGPGE